MPERTRKQQSFMHILVKGAAASFTVKITGAGIAFLFQIILARFAGKEEYGIYTYIIAWVTLAAMLAPLGVNRTAVKFIPAYISSKNYSSLHAFIKWITIFTITTSLTVAVLSILSINHLSIIDKQLINAFSLGCLLIPLTAMSQIGVEIIRALQHVALAEFTNVIIKPILIMITLVIMYFFTNTQPTAFNVILINIGTSILVILLLNKSVKKLVYPYTHIPSKDHKQERKLWLSTAIPLLFVIAGNIILGKTDVIMLGIITSTTDSGLYNAASRVSQLVGFPLLAINMILAPLISHIHAGKRAFELHRLVNKAAWFSFISCFILAFFIYIFSDIILELFGSSFKTQKTTLEILIIGQIISGIAGPAGYVLAMTGNQKILAYIVGIASLFNITLNYFLIPQYGTNGAALATLTTIIITNISMALVAIKRVKINPTIFSLRV